MASDPVMTIPQVEAFLDKAYAAPADVIAQAAALVGPPSEIKKP